MKLIGRGKSLRVLGRNEAVRMLLAKNDVERSSKSMTAVCDIKPPAKNWKAKDAQITNLNTWGEVQHFTPWN